MAEKSRADKQRIIKRRRRQARIKRNIKTVATIGVFTILFIIAAGAGLFYWYSLKSMGTVEYPSSPLSKMMDATYSYVTQKELPLSVSCPNIPITLSVSGSEMYASDIGICFNHGDGMILSVYEVYDKPTDVLYGDYGYDLYCGEPIGTPHFTLALDDIGYFNGYPASYMCGMLSLLSPANKSLQDVYVVSLTMDVGKAADLMIAVATTDKNQLYDASVLMQSVCYTVMDISNSKYLDETKVDESVVVQQEVVNEAPVDNTVSKLPTEESNAERYEINMTQVVDSADFVLQYFNKTVVPETVVLYDPNGISHTPQYINTNLDGQVRVKLSFPLTGKYMFSVVSSEPIGNAQAYVDVPVSTTTSTQIQVNDVAEGNGEVIEVPVPDPVIP